jgi:hypothetical protein
MAPRHLIIRSTAVQLTLNRNAAILRETSRLSARCEVFLGSMGLLTSPKSARRQVSGYVTCGFAYTSPYTLTPGQPSPGRATLLVL